MARKKLSTDSIYIEEVDDLILNEIKKLLGTENLPKGIQVSGLDLKTYLQNSQKTNEEKSTLSNSMSKANTTINTKLAFDILKFGQDSSKNPYCKGSSEEEIKAFSEEYSAAKDLLRSYIKEKGLDSLYNLPGRVLTTQRQFILSTVIQARDEATKGIEETLKQQSYDLQLAKQSITETRANINNLLNGRTPNELAEFEKSQLAQLQELLNTQYDKVSELASTIGTTESEYKDAQKAQKNVSLGHGRIKDKQLRKIFKNAEKREKKEEKTTFKAKLAQKKDELKQRRLDKKIDKNIEKSGQVRVLTQEETEEIQASRELAKKETEEQSENEDQVAIKDQSSNEEQLNNNNQGETEEVSENEEQAEASTDVISAEENLATADAKVAELQRQLEEAQKEQVKAADDYAKALQAQDKAAASTTPTEE